MTHRSPTPPHPRRAGANANRVPSRPRRRRGFLILDMITGLAVVGIIATTLVVLIGRERRIGAALGDRRAAARLAEATLADLRAGRQPTAGATSAEGGDSGNSAVQRVEVTPLPDPAPGVDRGRRWVQVRATVAGRAVTLVGLVPDGPGLRSATPSTRPATNGSNSPTREAP